MTNDSETRVGGSPHGRRRRALRWTLLAAIPVTAVVVAWLATRGGGDTTDSAGHLHGTGASAAAQPVMLSAEDARRIGVTYAVAKISLLQREIRTVGLVTFDETRVRSVSLKVDGWVEHLFVNYGGQAVAEGEPLLAIYSPMLVTAQEELLLARRLVNDVASGSPDARDNAAVLLRSARRRLEQWDVPAASIARIEASGSVERALTLTAPVTGFVVEKNVLQGQKVMAGDALYRIADLAVVWIEGDVFERDLPSVRLGQSVVAELDALPGRGLGGRIAYVNPTLNPDTRTTRIRVELPNPDFRLKPGMYATIHWSSAGRGATLSVPRSAVLVTGRRNLVFVKRADGMLEPREVEIGVTTDERIEILRGLAAGDSVVASATFLVDAESNLATSLGGMGNMPGMDMTAPRKPE